MKKIYVVLSMLICMMLAFSAQAADAAPGDTVTLPISVASTEAHQITLNLSINPDIFEFVKLESAYGQGKVAGSTGKLALFDILNPLNGKIGDITLAIKTDVKSGTYSIGVSVAEAWTLDEEKAEVSVSVGYVTVVTLCDHEVTETRVVNEADCDNDGFKQTVCVECEAVLETEAIESTGHDFSDFSERIAATCTTKGEEASECARCGKVNTREIAELGHSFGEYAVSKAATCTEKGEEVSGCVRCAETKTREIAAMGHMISEYTESIDATCTTEGSKSGSCARCTETLYQKIDPLGHDFSDITVIKTVTCTKDGEEKAVCTRCGETEYRTIEKLGHAFEGYEVLKPASCNERGEKVSRCANCGKENRLGIAAISHKFSEWIEVSAATCVTDGEKYRTCIHCGEIEEITFSSSGHNAVWKVITPAAIDKQGLKQMKCKLCNEVLDEQKIPSLSGANKTACTVGIKLGEFGPLIDQTDAWKMITPVDFSIEGEIRYPVIAGNVYEIGYVEVKVLEGVVTAELVIEADVVMYTAGLILFDDPDGIGRFNINDYEYYEFPAEIKMTNLPAEKMLMMVTCQVGVDARKPEPKYYNAKLPEYKALMENLNTIYGQYFEEKN